MRDAILPDDAEDLADGLAAEPAAASTGDGPRSDEWANATTHAVGLGASVVGAALLMRTVLRTGGPWEVAGCGIYAATLILLYAASTLSHVFHHPRAQQTFRTLDQAVIFLYIAGSWTPMALTWLRGGPWWVLHGAMWGVALVGFLSKAVFSHRVGAGSVSSRLYIVQGWLPALATWPLIVVVPRGALLWFLSGGICYMVGTFFFRYDYRVRYFHALWHLSVIAGSACTYMATLLYCTAPPPVPVAG